MYPGSGLSGEITPLLLFLVSYLSMNWNYNNSSGEGENHRGSLLLPGDDLLVVNELGAIGVMRGMCLTSPRRRGSPGSYSVSPGQLGHFTVDWAQLSSSSRLGPTD